MAYEALPRTVSIPFSTRICHEYWRRLDVMHLTPHEDTLCSEWTIGRSSGEADVAIRGETGLRAASSMRRSV